MMKYLNIRIILILLTAILLSTSLLYKNCNNKGNKNNSDTPEIDNSRLEENSENPDTDGYSIQGNQIRLTENVIDKLSLRFQQVETGSSTTTIELTGEIQADPDSTQSIGSRLPGRILKIRKKEGELVRKGEVLVEMDSPEVTRLRSQYKSSLSQYQTAKKNADRLREMVGMKLASDQELRNALTEAKTWEMESKSNRETLVLYGISPGSSGTRIVFRSPISGILIRRLVAPGDSVSENTNFAIVGNLNSVWFTANIFEKSLSYVRIGKEAKIKLNAYPDREFHGKITYIGTSIDTANRTIPARITLNNPKGELKIGLFGKAILDTERNSKEDSKENATSEMQVNKYPVIPREALVRIHNQEGVFVKLNELELEWRIVQVIGVNGDLVSIKDGLGTGDTILVDGTYALKSLFLKSSFGEED